VYTATKTRTRTKNRREMMKDHVELVARDEKEKVSRAKRVVGARGKYVSSSKIHLFLYLRQRQQKRGWSFTLLYTASDVNDCVTDDDDDSLFQTNVDDDDDDDDGLQ
jgi:hypothetical protein